MMIAFVILLIISSCEKGADPTIFSEPFSGITYTNAEGEIIGPVDEEDWNYGCCNWYSRWCPNTYPIDGVHLLPECYFVMPAYPNPSNNVSSIVIGMPVTSDWSVSVIHESRRIAFDTSGHDEAGYLGITIPLKEKEFQYGIYRVNINIGRFKASGDIWYTNNTDVFY
jgi:hypothetical protein